jgi:hypothetical protein
MENKATSAPLHSLVGRLPTPAWTPNMLGALLIAWGAPVKLPTLVDHWRERKKRKPNAKDQTAGAYPDPPSRG